MAAIVTVVALIAAAGLFGALGLGKKRNYNDVGYSSPTTTYRSGSSVNKPTTTTRPRATTTTSGRQTSTTGSRSTTSTTTAQSGPKPVFALADNPFHGQKVGAYKVTCNLPAWRTDPAAAQAFFTAALPCLEQAWAPALASVNLPYKTPGLEFPTGADWQSPCGGANAANVAAFYCGQNNTIYMPFGGLQTAEYGNAWGVYLAVFSHEFGHHIQNMTGILSTYWDARYEAGDQTAPGLELSRRAELQAQCIGGMWFAGAQHGGGSMTDQAITQMLDDGYTRGDRPNAPRDHGASENTGAWQEHGFRNNRADYCNTWSAGAEHVD